MNKLNTYMFLLGVSCMVGIYGMERQRTSTVLQSKKDAQENNLLGKKRKGERQPQKKLGAKRAKVMKEEAAELTLKNYQSKEMKKAVQILKAFCREKNILSDTTHIRILYQTLLCAIDKGSGSVDVWYKTAEKYLTLWKNNVDNRPNSLLQKEKGLYLILQYLKEKGHDCSEEKRNLSLVETAHIMKEKLEIMEQEEPLEILHEMYMKAGSRYDRFISTKPWCVTVKSSDLAASEK